MNSMKKIICTIVMLTIGIASCSSCAKKTQTVEVVPVPSASVSPVPSTPPVTTVAITHENMSVTLPGPGWNKLESEDIMSAYLNTNLKNIVILGKEPFTGTHDAYIIKAIMGARNAGATVLSSKQVTINGRYFILIEATKNMVNDWIWTTWEDGVGYGLTCAGPMEASPHDLCFGIASTLKLN